MERYRAAPTFGDFTDSSPDETTLLEFRNEIYEYYGGFGRSMPWRETEDPYRILVSEIMLQQTQVRRVLPKYRALLDRWPTIGALASASQREMLELWQGLGYNRRGLALLEIARIVVNRFGGSIPRDRDSLLSLPMVGPSTAAGIRCFSFSIPDVYLETNVRRVYLHFFFYSRDRVADREIVPIAEAALDREDPRNWSYALMDYGVFLKDVVPNPNRRSRSYARQAPFEGSDRQIRGRILSHLVATDEADLSTLESLLPFEPDRIARCASALVGEGMIAEDEGVYRIPDRD